MECSYTEDQNSCTKEVLLRIGVQSLRMLIKVNLYDVHDRSSSQIKICMLFAYV